MTENEIGKQLVHAALQVHRNTGPGLLESAYQACLEYELKKSGLFTEKEVALPVIKKSPLSKGDLGGCSLSLYLPFLWEN